MAHRKAGGTVKNLRDSKPKYLGIKLQDGSKAQSGSILVRQRGTRYLAGKNVRVGNDHTLYAIESGTVSFTSKQVKRFDGKKTLKKMVSVV